MLSTAPFAETVTRSDEWPTAQREAVESLVAQADEHAIAWAETLEQLADAGAILDSLTRRTRIATTRKA